MGAISALVFSKISDRFYWRMPFVVIPFTLVTIGFSVMLGLQGRFEENIGAAYTAVIIACMGIYPYVADSPMILPRFLVHMAETLQSYARCHCLGRQQPCPGLASRCRSCDEHRDW